MIFVYLTLPNLFLLAIKANSINQNGLEDLSNLIELTNLSLNVNHQPEFTSENINKLTQLTNLKMLSLRYPNKNFHFEERDLVTLLAAELKTN